MPETTPHEVLHLIPLSTGDEVPMVRIDDQPMVVIARAITAMGLDAETQMKRLRRQPWADLPYANLPAADGRNRRVVLASPSVFLMWLATVEVGKVTESKQAVLRAYQCETRDAIDSYWRRGIAVNRRDRTDAEVALIETVASGTGAFLGRSARARNLAFVVLGKRGRATGPAATMDREAALQELANNAIDTHAQLTAEDGPMDALAELQAESR